MHAQSQKLSLEQSQQMQMILAPQLRQSLEMLQLPILELRTMIQQEMERNPTLEEVPTDSMSVLEEVHSDIGEDGKELNFDKEFEVLARLDDEWREYFFQELESRPYSEDAEEKRRFFMDSIPEMESLQEHLLRQLNLTELSQSDREIGELIIGNINDDGYLTATPEELAESAGCDVDHLNTILSIIRDFHPTGVCAYDLADCLVIQLERLGKSGTLAEQIIRHHLELLGAKKYDEIAKLIGVQVSDVMEAAKLIATLDPKPGKAFSSGAPTYILPEVIVEKINEKWTVILNDDYLPRIRISEFYKRMLREPSTDSEVKKYIQERVRSATFLVKSIEQRQNTIYRTASQIVAVQTDFFEHGVSHLKPLSMAQVADAVGVHETTISRTVSGKYMATPYGIFEMKYFFSPGIKTLNGELVANKTVIDMIGRIVMNEDPLHPLSDQEIAERLHLQGIELARRTVAKYRVLLRIPSSHIRGKNK